MVMLLVLVGVLHVSSMPQVSVLSEATVGLDDLVDANAFEDGSTVVVAAGGEREATNIHRWEFRSCQDLGNFIFLYQAFIYLRY